MTRQSTHSYDSENDMKTLCGEFEEEVFVDKTCMNGRFLIKKFLRFLNLNVHFSPVLALSSSKGFNLV
jgi:hypothetical protein